MSIEAVSFLAPSQPIGTEVKSAATGVSGDFSTWLNQHVDGLNQQLLESDNQLRSLAMGKTENLHQVMLSLEQTKISFELALQVRNKLLDAYQDIMRMQI